MEFAIRTQSLTKIFGSLTAVNSLDLEVPAGSVFGLLGPNGAGKTTTFSMICGFIRPTDGDAWVLGERLADLNKVISRVSALPQDASFHPARRVGDVLNYFARLGGMDQTTARNEVTRVLDAVGMTSTTKMKGNALSHGMAKRLGLAQAFLGSPELVLLDEPTEGLDPKAAHTIREMIRALASHNTTVLVSSHNLAEVQDLCDHAAIIDHGSMVKSGSLDELTMTNEVVIISLGPGSDPTAAISAMPQVQEVQKNENKLRVTFKPAVDKDVEIVITSIIRVAIENGASIGEVTRGRGLEERYLELT